MMQAHRLTFAKTVLFWATLTLTLTKTILIKIILIYKIKILKF